MSNEFITILGSNLSRPVSRNYYINENSLMSMYYNPSAGQTILNINTSNNPTTPSNLIFSGDATSNFMSYFKDLNGIVLTFPNGNTNVYVNPSMINCIATDNMPIYGGNISIVCNCIVLETAAQIMQLLPPSAKPKSYNPTFFSKPSTSQFIINKAAEQLEEPCLSCNIM